MSETCRALHVTRQGYCAWRKRRPSAHGERDAGLAGKISEICAAGRGVHGAPKVLAELKRAGGSTSRKRVARIMRESGWAGTTRGGARRPRSAAEPAAPQADTAPDPVRREFVFSQVLLSEKSAPFFRVSSRKFFGFRRGHAANFLTCPA